MESSWVLMENSRLPTLTLHAGTSLGPRAPALQGRSHRRSEMLWTAITDWTGCLGEGAIPLGVVPTPAPVVQISSHENAEPGEKPAPIQRIHMTGRTLTLDE